MTTAPSEPGDLETAGTQGLRRIAIDAVTRVEGHGKVTLLVDDDDRVRQVRFHVVEFRGFERFVVGRPFWEVPVLVQRLCGICPVSHQLAAAKAFDAVVGARPLPDTADRVRRLMHHGQVLQSHALHFFHLASPDLLFGLDAAPEQRDVTAVLAAHPDVARRGILLRKFGQEVIRVTSGKRVHGTGAIPGGVNKRITPEERDELARAVPDVLAWAEDAVALVAELHAKDAALWDRFGAVPTKLLSLVAPDGALDLYDGVLRMRDEDGTVRFDGLACEDYGTRLREDVKSWSYMKFPYLADLGPERGWYTVGPLARVQNADRIPTPRAEAARRAFLATSRDGALVHAPLATHHARLVELLHAAEVIAALLEDPVLLGDTLTARGPRTGAVVGVIEAPRGTLIHHYEVDDRDLVTACNLIVSTTHNNQAINEAIREVARQEWGARRDTARLLSRIEVAIRAYDPCLSCATHALGRMPLDVRVERASTGELLARHVRDGHEREAHEAGA